MPAASVLLALGVPFIASKIKEHDKVKKMKDRFSSKMMCC
jgi:hypothetical protein